MKRKRRFVLSEKTFGFSVLFFVGYPQEVAIKACAQSLGVETEAPDGTAFAWACVNGNWAVVWMQKYPEGDNFGALVHELYHVVHGFLSHIETRDEETGAYLIQYLYKEARRRLDRK